MLLATIFGIGCGSSSDLVIGHDSAISPEAGGSGGSAEPLDGAPEAASDTGIDAELDADGAPDAAACADGDVAPPGSLVHRYSFDGTGAIATDSVGAADGQIEPGGALDGNGTLVLDGLTGYVNLPNHLISVLSDVTFVTWTTFRGGSGYERIFDFGVGDATTGQGQSYVAVSPYGGDSRLLMLARQNGQQAEVQLTSAADINDAKEHQVALVFVGASRAELYLDGQLLGRTPITFPLSDIVDENDWLGRSQWIDDNYYSGTIDEFRIYGQALTPCAIQALNDAGPNAL